MFHVPAHKFVAPAAREIISAGATACLYSRLIAASQFFESPRCSPEEIGALDATDWIPTGGVTVSDDYIAIHCARRA